MTLEQAREMLAAALVQAAAEHGRPNSFSCGELFHFYGGPPVMLAGRIGARYRVSLWQILGGPQKWGSCPTYHNGRYYV